jgi:hypothetical protein
MVIRLTLLNDIDQLLCILHTDTVADTFGLVAGPPPPLNRMPHYQCIYTFIHNIPIYWPGNNWWGNCGLFLFAFRSELPPLSSTTCIPDSERRWRSSRHEHGWKGGFGMDGWKGASMIMLGKEGCRIDSWKGGWTGVDRTMYGWIMGSGRLFGWDWN